MTQDKLKLLTISALAKETGLTQRIIHLHEERGLIASVRNGDSGNRYFTPQTVLRLNKVKQLQAIGLSLQEIAEVLPLYMDGDDHGVRGKEAALAILHRHLAETDQHIESLGQLREEIIKSIARLEVLLEQYRQLNRS
ncbi:MAG: MerR family transcriptional regulator [Neisseria sp.]|nr:MerR family transcriptional regulator [Neisseria sp.]